MRRFGVSTKDPAGWKIWAALVVFCFLVLGPSCSHGWRLVRVIDGDTIRVRRGTVEEKVRFKGVDAPEIAHPDYGKFDNEYYGRESKECLARVLDGHTLRLDYATGGAGPGPERDKYGRLLAYVWAGPTLANGEVIRLGCARAFRKYPHPRLKEFLRLEDEARRAGRGLWKRPKSSNNN